MSGRSDATELLRHVAGYVGGVQPRRLASRLGTIPSDYAGGLISVVFDGEVNPAGDRYRWLYPYQPAAGDRVLLEPIGTTWVVMGSITEDRNQAQRALVLKSPDGNEWTISVTNAGAIIATET